MKTFIKALALTTLIYLVAQVSHFTVLYMVERGEFYRWLNAVVFGLHGFVWLASPKAVELWGRWFTLLRKPKLDVLETSKRRVLFDTSVLELGSNVRVPKRSWFGVGRGAPNARPKPRNEA